MNIEKIKQKNQVRCIDIIGSCVSRVPLIKVEIKEHGTLNEFIKEKKRFDELPPETVVKLLEM